MADPPKRQRPGSSQKRPRPLPPLSDLDPDLSAALTSPVDASLRDDVLSPRFEGDRLQKWVWALSGGGAKGAFEAGAMLYLSTRASLYPEAVCGTSVGALNALAAAEATEEGVLRVKDTWCSLTSNGDMWEVAGWLEEIAGLETFRPLDLVPRLLAALDLAPDEAGSGGFNLISTGDEALAVLGNLIVPPPFFALDVLDDVEAVERDLRRAEEVFRRDGRSLLSLAPTREIASRNLRVDRIQASGTLLRLISVGLEDGYVYVVTEKGELVRHADTTPAAGMERPHGTRHVHQLQAESLHDALIKGAMASAAIPLTFPPETLSTEDGASISCVDGGVREVLPIREAMYLAQVDLAETPGQAGVIGIFAGHVGNVDGAFLIDPIWQDRPSFNEATLLEIAIRGSEIAVDEVALDELRRMKTAASDVDLIPIFPLFSVCKTGQIDPGLIQIQLAYGYMTAHDTVRYYLGEIDNSAFSQLFLTTNFIAQARRAAWELERHQELVGSPPPGRRTWIWEEGSVTRLRHLKRQISEAIWVRAVALGTYDDHLPDSSQISNPAVGNRNRFSDWYQKYEYHSLDSPYYLPAVPQASGTGSVFNRGDNSPWTEKTERDSAGNLMTIPAEDPPHPGISV